MVVQDTPGNSHVASSPLCTPLYHQLGKNEEKVMPCIVLASWNMGYLIEGPESVVHYIFYQAKSTSILICYKNPPCASLYLLFCSNPLKTFHNMDRCNRDKCIVSCANARGATGLIYVKVFSDYSLSHFCGAACPLPPWASLEWFLKQSWITSSLLCERVGLGVIAGYYEAISSDRVR